MWLFTGKPESHDPIFGTIRFDRRRERWNGQVSVPSLSAGVNIAIGAGEAGPSDRQRAIAARFIEEFPRILPGLQSAVLDHYQRVREAWKADVELPEVSDSETLWASLQLLELEVTPDCKHFWPELELMLHFNAPWDEEHGLQLAIGDNKLLEVRDE
jgi:hypothetical protein